MAFPLVLGLTQCGKKDDPAANAATSQGDSSEVSGKASATSALVTNASKLGFAARLPMDTELYFGSAQLKAHLDAVKKSAWWKEISARIDDKTPAPSGDSDIEKLLTEAWGDDVFIAGATGFTESAALLRDFNRAYNEIYLKLIMLGGVASMQGSPMNNPLAMFMPLMTDQASLDSLGELVTKFQLPPLVIGLKTTKGRELLAQLFSEQNLKNKPEQVDLSDFKTPEGFEFKVVSIDMAKALPEEKAKELLANMSTLPPQTVSTLEKALADVRQKKFVIGFGVVGDHFIVTTGRSMDHVKFAAEPSKSLLAKPDLAWLQPYAANNVAGLMYASGAVQTALHDDLPLVPMLRGVVSALKGNEMFKPMGDIIEPQLNELTPLESAVYSAEFTNLAGIFWWDQGMLQMEAFGGPKSKFMAKGKPAAFAPLVDRPGVFFGIAYHRDAAYEQAVRLWIEKLFGIFYTAGQELVKAGIAGPNGAQQFAMVDMMLLPQLKKLYAADRDITEKGLGGQLAFVLDVNGKMPSLPNVPLEDAKKLNFPRLTIVAEVVNRAEVAKGWASINETITGLAAIAGSMSGGGGAAPMLPAPISAQANGMTTWFYENPFFNGDLYPAAAISDKLLVVSSSRPAAEAFSADLAKPAATTVEGCVWRLDLSALATFVTSVAALEPSSSSADIEEMKQVMKFLQPFQAMQGHMFEEKGQPRFSLKWKLGDVVSFD